MASDNEVTWHVERQVAVIGLNRPDSLNAFTPTMGAQLRAAVGRAALSDEIRVIVLTGNGRGFCAGADMKVLQGIKADGTREAPQADPELQPLTGVASLGPSVAGHYRARFGYLMSVPKPVIAAINGPAAGLGLVLALYTDLRFAGSEARFTTSFAQRGLVAEHGLSWLLPRLVGQANALDLLFSARKIGADEAERIGLINRVFPQASLMQEVMGYAGTLAQTVSPRSMAVMKAQILKAPFQDFNEALAVADAEMKASFATQDFREGVAHYVEKRAPRFTGH
jgi:enoyl-CoA hydratase/carnithine racemase